MEHYLIKRQGKIWWKFRIGGAFPGEVLVSVIIAVMFYFFMVNSCGFWGRKEYRVCKIWSWLNRCKSHLHDIERSHHPNTNIYYSYLHVKSGAVCPQATWHVSQHRQKLNNQSVHVLFMAKASVFILTQTHGTWWYFLLLYCTEVLCRFV